MCPRKEPKIQYFYDEISSFQSRLKEKFLCDGSTPSQNEYVAFLKTATIPTTRGNYEQIMGSVPLVHKPQDTLHWKSWK